MTVSKVIVVLKIIHKGNSFFPPLFSPFIQFNLHIFTLVKQAREGEREREKLCCISTL